MTGGLISYFLCISNLSPYIWWFKSRWHPSHRKPIYIFQPIPYSYYSKKKKEKGKPNPSAGGTAEWAPAAGAEELGFRWLWPLPETSRRPSIPTPRLCLPPWSRASASSAGFRSSTSSPASPTSMPIRPAPSASSSPSQCPFLLLVLDLPISSSRPRFLYLDCVWFRCQRWVTL